VRVLATKFQNSERFYGKHHTRFRYGSSFLGLLINSIRPASSYTWTLRPDVRRWYASHHTSFQCPVVCCWDCSDRRPKTISHFIGLNIWRLSLSRRGANVQWTSLCWQCQFRAYCIHQGSRVSVTISRRISVTEHVNNLLASCAHTLFTMLVYILQPFSDIDCLNTLHVIVLFIHFTSVHVITITAVWSVTY